MTEPERARSINFTRESPTAIQSSLRRRAPPPPADRFKLYPRVILFGSDTVYFRTSISRRTAKRH